MQRAAFRFTAVLFLLSFPACDDVATGTPVAGGGPGPAPDGTYRNPVLNRDFPDPTVIRADGWYYGYATETIDGGRRLNIQVARSSDLVTWEHLGDALPAGITWAQQTRHYWAPHVQYAPESGRYIMYFSAHHDELNGKCLAVAIAEDPAGPFLAREEPLTCGPGFEDIDPMAFDDPVSGRRLLYWGSGGGPIRVRELANDRIRWATGSQEHALLHRDPAAPYSDLVEGAWVVFRDGRYYLFHSGDNCCGLGAHYAVLVARADDPFGPFETMASVRNTDTSVILSASPRWNAPGHNSVIRDDAGRDWMVYHAIDPARPTLPTATPWDRRVMMMDPIHWEDGWPSVDSGQPSSDPVEAPIVD